MNNELSNLWMFVRAIAVVSIVTGFAPGMAFSFFYERRRAKKTAQARWIHIAWRNAPGRPLSDQKPAA